MGRDNDDTINVRTPSGDKSMASLLTPQKPKTARHHRRNSSTTSLASSASKSGGRVDKRDRRRSKSAHTTGSQDNCTALLANNTGGETSSASAMEMTKGEDARAEDEVSRKEVKEELDNLQDSEGWVHANQDAANRLPPKTTRSGKRFA